MFRVLLKPTQRAGFQLNFSRNYVRYKDYYIHHIDDARLAILLLDNPEAVPLGTFIHQKWPSKELTNDNAEELIELNESTFREEPKFLLILFDFLKRNVHNDYSYQLETADYNEGYMPIYDFRKVPEYGRRSDVDDVYGWVRVDDKDHIVKDSFQANDMYRIFNEKSGLPVFSDFMKEGLGKA